MRRVAPLIRGNALCNIRSYVLEHHGGAALDALLAGLDPDLASALRSPRFSEWYPAEMQSTLLFAVDARFGRGDLGLIPAIGGWQCSRDLASPLGLVFRLFPLAKIMAYPDVVWRRFHNTGRWVTGAEGGTTWMRLSAWDGGSAAACPVLRGYLERLVHDMTGDRERIEHPCCAFRGGVVCEFTMARRIDAVPPLPMHELSAHELPALARDLAQLPTREDTAEAIAGLVRVHLPGCDAALSLPDANGEFVPVVVHGRPRARYPHRWLLEFGGELVGALEAHIDPDAPDDPRLRLMNDLVPWFGLALRGKSPRGTVAEDVSMPARIAAAIERFSLTPRQGQVVGLLVEGQSNRQISQTLGCSEGTVEVHISAIYRKVRVDGRTRLIARVLECAPLRSQP
jgi:DNA-binding CsgD family transcriptional regulator